MVCSVLNEISITYSTFLSLEDHYGKVGERFCEPDAVDDKEMVFFGHNRAIAHMKSQQL